MASESEVAFDVSCVFVAGCFFLVGFGASVRLYRQRATSPAPSASATRKRRPGGTETRNQFHVGIAASNFARGCTVLYATLERREHLSHYSTGGMPARSVDKYTW
jgi:hypothetical protein